VTHNATDDEDSAEDFTVDLARIEATLAGPMALNRKRQQNPNKK
jgi:hypothetical protein